MKVIFLDIDGVLNRLGAEEEGRTTTKWNGFVGMEPELVQRFNALVRKTGAQVVLSSTWRLSDTWKEDMRGNGLDFEFLDRTPQLRVVIKHISQRLPWVKAKHVLKSERGLEIDEWLSEHPEVEKYVIIDDDSDMLDGQTLFQTSFVSGLTKDIAEKIEKHLL